MDKYLMMLFYGIIIIEDSDTETIDVGEEKRDGSTSWG